MIFSNLMCARTVAAVLLTGCMIVVPQKSEAQSTTYTGEAVVVSARVLGIQTTVSDTGSLPGAGGALSTSLADFTLSGLLDLHLLTAATNGGGNRTYSQASVANVTLTVVGVDVRASVLTSNATAACSSNQATVSGASGIADIKVNGLTITVTGAPNQTVPLLVGSLVINEQISSVNNGPGVSSGDMVVNAIHLKVLGIADVVISSSHAGISCITGLVG